MDCLIYTPICPHSLFSRSVIFGGSTHLTVDIPRNLGRLFLTVDGEDPVELRSGYRLRLLQVPAGGQVRKAHRL